MGPTKMGKNSKMVNIDFLGEKSSNREGDDKALGKVMKTYAHVKEVRIIDEGSWSDPWAHPWDSKWA